MADVLVLGGGLIGTSIALALRGAADVVLHDHAPSVAQEAVARGGGRRWDGHESAEVVVVAVPPNVTGTVLVEAQRRDLGLTYTHVCSVQSQVQRDIESLSSDLSTVVGGHPLAGRESSGPGAATGDLFVGRPWAVCPSLLSSPTAVRDVWELAQACGAVPLALDAEAHDATVGLLSHLPQVMSTALAGQLVGKRTGRQSDSTVLSGPGLVDTTRLAASDPALWTEILGANARHVVPAVRALIDDLDQLAAALEADERATVLNFLERGNQGRSLVPVKRGEVSGAFHPVRVSVDDRPGVLASLLAAAGGAGVNVEDVRVEHIPGRPQGVIELLVEVGSVELLQRSLLAAGWHVLS